MLDHGREISRSMGKLYTFHKDVFPGFNERFEIIARSVMNCIVRLWAFSNPTVGMVRRAAASF